MTDRTHSGLWGRGIERRAFLRGLGVCIALPTLESFAGPVLKAATRAGAAPRLATTAGGMPLRLGFIGFANGSNYERWLPQGTGRDYTLNETFEPIGDMRQRFQILTSLAHDAANSWGDGPGDHARAGATFLTGCHAWKTLGAQLHLGISVDQIAARQVGHLTRLTRCSWASKERGCMAHATPATRVRISTTSPGPPRRCRCARAESPRGF